jgi:hypothetical protein
MWKTQITLNLIIVFLQTVRSRPDVTERYVLLLRLYIIATKDTSVSGVGCDS